MTTELCLAPISAQRRLIDAHEVSCVELAEVYLRRIERLDGRRRVFATVTPERALADARRADAEMANGPPRSLLHGIPVGLKDLIDTAGIATTASSRVLAGRVPVADAAVATLLREAGSVLLGKLRLTEFATGKTYRADGAAPQPPNPWAPDRFPGGSSSGAAVAAATGLTGVSIGSDTGGSIRVPAAWSGVVGMKPTYALIPTEGVIPLAPSLDHLGPLARSVLDAALVLDVLAPMGGARGRARYTAEAATTKGTLRLGVPRRLVEATELAPAVRSAFEEALAAYSAMGATLSEVELPPRTEVEAVFLAISGAEAAAVHREWLRTSRQLYGRGTLERLSDGLRYGAPEYADAQRRRAAIVRSFEAEMSGVDVIVVPSLPRTAPTFDEHELAPALPRAPFLDLANLVGSPALSLPCGFDDLGLPIGLHLMGRRMADGTVLRIAAAFERATAWHERVPPLATRDG